MSKKGRKFMSMLIGFGLISILLYSLVYLITVTTPSLAIPPKQSPTPPPPTATPVPPTPTPGGPTPTPIPPTPTPQPPTGRLDVQTIPQDDQLRKKGIIFTEGFAFGDDYHAEYKIDVRQNGVDVDATIECIVIQKKICNPKNRQIGLITEEEITELIDRSDSCECFFRQKTSGRPGVSVPGVGVIDLYCDFPDSRDFWGDYIFKIVASKGSDRGSEIQDLCVLHDSNCDANAFETCHDTGRFPWSKDEAFGFRESFFHHADAIFPFSSCKNAALFQGTSRGFDGDDNLPECTFF